MLTLKTTPTNQNPSALTKFVRQLKHSVTAAWAEDKQTKLLLLLSFSLLHYYFCLHSMQVFNWMSPFLAFLHPERSQVAISWSYSCIYSFNPELDQSSLAWLIHRDDKTACLALCLQSPARTDAPLDLPHIWQRTKINGWMNELSQLYVIISDPDLYEDTDNVNGFSLIISNNDLTRLEKLNWNWNWILTFIWLKWNFRCISTSCAIFQTGKQSCGHYVGDPWPKQTLSEKRSWQKTWRIDVSHWPQTLAAGVSTMKHVHDRTNPHSHLELHWNLNPLNIVGKKWMFNREKISI